MAVIEKELTHGGGRREALLFYKAAEHKVIIKDTAMDYVEFGYGSRPLIILPGLGDGLRTVHGQAVNLAFYYRKIAPYYRVYIFSRKNKLEEGYTTKDMAEDLWLALEQLRPLNTEKICAGWESRRISAGSSSRRSPASPIMPMKSFPG